MLISAIITCCVLFNILNVLYSGFMKEVVYMSPFINKLNIAVCDDRSSDRNNTIQLIEKYLDQHHYVANIDEFVSGEDFLSADTSIYDIVVLDIFMDELNGIQVAEKLASNHPNVQIIFCSTSNAYATESYDVGALRYLTKPIKEEKLFRTLDRYFIAHTALRTLNYKQNRMDDHVYLSDVLWIEAGDHKSIIHTKTEQIVTGTQFKQLCEQVEDADFVKPIRYALVSLQAVVAIPTDVFTLSDGTTIPISRNLRLEMKKAFADYKMKSLLKRGGAW